MERYGASPGRLILIGVLAVVLAVVLFLQFGGSSDDDAYDAAIPPKASRLPRPLVEAGNALPTTSGDAEASREWRIETVDRRNWASPDVARVVRYDPFALPAAFPQPVRTAEGTLVDGEGAVVDAGFSEERRAQDMAAIQAKLEELKQRGVRVIISGHKEAAAVVGDRTVRVGDDLEGFTVKAIEADGVIVERKLD
jgi:hypothetical protein